MLKKKNLISVLSIALVAMLAVTGSLALYTYLADSVTNTFTFTSAGIEIEIVEESWVPGNAQDITFEDVTDGKTVAKDPQFENTSVSGVGVYGALRLTWVKGTSGDALTGAEYAALIKGKVTLNDLNAGYTNTLAFSDSGTDPSSAIYFWNNEVAAGALSGKLFSGVTFQGLTGDQIEQIIEWGGISLKVEAAATDKSVYVKAEETLANSGAAAVRSAVVALFPAI